MKITGRVETEVVTDVKCDICTRSTRVDAGGLQFATLKAKWGFGTKHDGERYEFHLCEGCFFGTIAYFKQERRVENLFDETDQVSVNDDFGLVTRDDFFGDSESGG
ncbi:hypothetical protein IV01_12320 [Pseudomonas syringae]|uniref:Uncharacterized protein n=1 Tax=Pseudomonas syringae TaxID=317 RepID=A0A085VIZ1_PSESX|nr:hypothetical protein IV01_12320 [Pseudomonas syringae]